MTLKFSPQWTVYSSDIGALLQAAEFLGICRQGLLSSVGIAAETLKNPECRLPVSLYYNLFQMIAAQSGNPDLGLLVGRIAHTNGLNLRLYMSTICQSFRDYLNLMPSVLTFSGDIGEARVIASNDLLKIEWQPLLPQTNCDRYLSDTFLATSVATLNSICPRPIKIVKVDLSYARPKDCNLLEDILGSAMHFEQPSSGVYFEREVLNWPLCHLEVPIAKGMQAQLQHLFEHNREDQFMHTLQQSVLKLLPSGLMNIASAAGALNVSKRTLQRRLGERDTTFVQVVQDIRIELSKRYIEDPRLNLAEMAFLLGYADQSSFTSAFKSWHGCSPSKY